MSLKPEDPVITFTNSALPEAEEWSPPSETMAEEIRFSSDDGMKSGAKEMLLPKQKPTFPLTDLPIQTPQYR